VHHSPPLGLRFRGRRAERIHPPEQEWPQQILSAGTDVESALVPQVGGFVIVGGEDPDAPTRVDVFGTNPRDLAGPRRREQLQLDGRPHLPSDMGLDRVDVRFEHRSQAR
jgi:hypothetical protein